MFSYLLKKLLGSKNDRTLKRMRKTVVLINTHTEAYKALTDQQLQAKTAVFKQRLQQGETLDALLPEAFAAVREASDRVLGLRHFDVQLMGGIALHEGRIAEMRTGEGKTLVATLAFYLNALAGKGVHLVTVNDYLAQRDANWMGPIYRFLGMQVGCVTAGQTADDKAAAYAADITYGTNNEFGFDYLRDNMVFNRESRVQRGLFFSIVDEVDSILIDEARTPLIISGPTDDNSVLYRRINQLIPPLKQQTDEEGSEGHFIVDEKTRQVEMTEQGHLFIEELLSKEGLLEEGDSLYAANNLALLHHMLSGLRAHFLFKRDVDYIVQDGQIALIDEHTGRILAGRRLSGGLHQAIEAKEEIDIQAENQTLASTTFQNYFRLYDKLAGMTGTADTEAFEFQQIYGLDVVVIPTNVSIVRKDLNDLIYLSKVEKYEAIVKDVKVFIAAGVPILVGTATVKTSEELSALFDKAGIEHKVLNAKFHQQEASIIAQAGRPGVVTIATNMAGRGTDIVLGGNVEVEIADCKDPTDETAIAALRTAWQERHRQVIEGGGLHIVGTERHESRRIDNQLRGRAGRQGDPGLSRFYLSMDDDLMRIFASDRVRSFMQALGMEKGEAIEHRMVSNAIERAQRKVEGRNFDMRKQLLEFDDVANEQRQIVYRQRVDLLESNAVSETIEAIRSDVVHEVIDEYMPPKSFAEQWDVTGLEKRLTVDFAVELPLQQWLDDDDQLYEDPLRKKIIGEIAAAYEAKGQAVGDESMHRLERHIMLQVLDNLWKEHLATMDHLRQSIGLRAYAQKNPKQEYKREAFVLFQALLNDLKHEVIRLLSHLTIRRKDEVDALENQRRQAEANKKMTLNHAAVSPVAAPQAQGSTAKPAAAPPFVRQGAKVGRNQSCPCGSGKKYKQCHGKLS